MNGSNVTFKRRLPGEPFVTDSAREWFYTGMDGGVLIQLGAIPEPLATLIAGNRLGWAP